MNEDPAALLPELVLVVGAVVTLGVGMFSPRSRQWAARLVAAGTLLAALVAGVVALGQPARLVFDDSYTVDGLLAAARLIVPAAALLTIGLSVDSVAGTVRETEFYVLVLLASLGSLVLAGAGDLLVLAAGFLLATVPLYGLAGLVRTPSATEAALKLYLLGALLGVVMLLGITILSGVGGFTSYTELGAGLAAAPRAALAVGTVALLAGLLFKAGAVPGHFWVPDVAEGTPLGVAAFLTTVPKVGALIALYRVVALIGDGRVDVPLLLGVLAAASMTLGNLAAFAQTSVRRLLGYSTIAQVGYLLMAVAVAGRTGLAVPGLAFYLAAYAVTNLGAFAVVAALQGAGAGADTLAGYRGLGRRRPVLAGALLVCLLGLVGTPPTAVFVGKLTVFAAAWAGGLAWLTVIAAVNTVASLFYYLRWLAPMFGGGASGGRASEGGASEGGASGGGASGMPAPGRRGGVSASAAAAAAVAAAACSVLLGVAAGPLLTLTDLPRLR